jgi:hypothetical protein
VVERTWREFGDELHLFFRKFPLSHIPPHAQAAAETAEASGSQGRFWEMHGVRFNNPRATWKTKTSGTVPRSFASTRSGSVGSSRLHARVRRVREHLEGGLESGVQGMPTFYVNGVHHDGSTALETLRAAIEAARSFAATPEQARRAGVMPNTGGGAPERTREGGRVLRGSQVRWIDGARRSPDREGRLLKRNEHQQRVFGRISHNGVSCVS